MTIVIDEEEVCWSNKKKKICVPRVRFEQVLSLAVSCKYK